MTADRLIFFHAPRSRSTGVLTLMHELNAQYELKLLDLAAGDTRKPEFLAINPMGKVPAILHGDALVTEQPAVYLYLAELYPEAGITPMPGDALRGPFLRWLAFYGSSFEPAITDKSLGREPAPLARSPYGTFELVQDAVLGQLRKGGYMAGERFTAADVLWGSALDWMLQFNLMPAEPALTDYVARVTGRPAFARARAHEASLLANLGH